MFIPVIILFLAFVIFTLLNTLRPSANWVLIFLLSSVISSLVVFLYGKYVLVPIFRRWMRKNSAKIYTAEMNPGLLGDHTLEVDEEGFTTRSMYITSRCAWGSLTGIESEPGYTYLMMGVGKALILPHASITSGDLRTVLETIKRHYHPGKALPS